MQEINSAHCFLKSLFSIKSQKLFYCLMFNSMRSPGDLWILKFFISTISGLFEMWIIELNFFLSFMHSIWLGIVMLCSYDSIIFLLFLYFQPKNSPCESFSMNSLKKMLCFAYYHLYILIKQLWSNSTLEATGLLKLISN